MVNARLIFEDGTIFEGRYFTQPQTCFAEVVFNTAMTGYQEVITDPSYSGQMVLMTYPHIGNYGINKEDVESRSLFLDALIVKEYHPMPSNWRSEKTLKDYLDEHNVVGIEDIDTRAVTRYIREKGAQKAMITESTESIDVLVKKVQASDGLEGRNLVDGVTCEDTYSWPCDAEEKYRVAVIDCGVKYMILRQLNQLGCVCDIYPSTVSKDTILDKGYDGVFLSNGPGDPAAVTHVISVIQAVLGKIPIFGICLGHQLLGLALGQKTYKLKFGHHGANHPVKNLKTEKIEITSQNHGFCIDPSSINEDDVAITHLNLNDQTIEGIRHKTLDAFSVQYHPEAAPGPHDSHYLFSEFISMMGEKK